MNESIDKIMPVLEKLARKFNTTTDHLWEIMVRQAVIDGCSNLILYIVGIVLCLIGVKMAFVFYKKMKLEKEAFHERAKLEGREGGRYYIGDNCYGVIFIISIIVITVVYFIVMMTFLFSITNTITALANPEYWALEKLFSVFKSI